MKIINLTMLALGFLMLNAVSCVKEDGDTLPPETQEGKNTFGCLVNGKVWQKGGKFSFPRSNLASFVSEHRIGITAAKFGDHIFQTITLDVNGPVKPGIYYLNTCSRVAKFIDEETNCYYQTDSISSNGTLEITKFDTINKILSGKFNFNALKYNLGNVTNNGHCDTIIGITEGRFDLKYSIQ